MINKKGIASIEIMLMILGLFAFAFMLADVTPTVSAAPSTMSNPSTCCEKTNDGAYCINTDEDNCEGSFKSSPTSCDTTSYCKLGTCYDSEEGICMENTPQRVCVENSGTWDARPVEEVPQCQLGCCILSDQAAFVPLVRCKRLSTLFGVSNDYRKDISSELDCINTAQSQDTGACVYEQDFERTCEFTTRDECGAGNIIEEVNGTNVTLASEKRFYKDYLCSAEELNTACARQTSTTCYGGDVYWVDSCGNRENVYAGGNDAGRDDSWNHGLAGEPEEICDANDGSNKNCGNCDYFLGSRCEEWDGLLGIGKPAGADHFCQKTECEDRDGDKRINGESWCVQDSPVGNGADPVGARNYREVCVDGDVRVEPCADFRNEVCLTGAIDTDAGEFGTAACRVNRWQDCATLVKEKDCNNTDQRDCMWLPPVTGMILGGGEGEGKFSNPTTGGSSFSNPTASEGESFGSASTGAAITGNAVFGGGDSGEGEDEEEDEETVTNRPEGVCVPNYSPGLEFWEDGSAKGICGQASAKCVVIYEKNLLGKESCVENCECLEEEWAAQANQVCTALGDCGGYINYKGKYNDDGYVWNVDGEDKKFAQNTVNQITSITGLVITITGFAEKDNKPNIGQVATIVPAVVPLLGGTDILADAGIPGPIKPSLGPQVSGKVASQTIAPVSQASKVAEIAKQATTFEYAKLPSKYTLGGKEFSYLGKGSDGNYIMANKAGGNIGKITPEQFGKMDVKALEFSEYKTPFKGGQGYLAEMFGTTAGSATSALLTGLQWAAMAAGIGYMVGGLLGFDDNNKQALAAALGGGAFVWKGITSSEALASSAIGPSALPIGIGVAAIIFVIMYRTTETKIVKFSCQPWQAPTGGNECEECNDPDLPCSEYRCKALGQNCELVNEGSEQERCVNVNPGDVNPPVISPNNNDLTFGHEYTDVKRSPPGPGFKIVSNNTDGCIKAFTPLEFGVDTDEPAQCKIDFEHTTTIEEMKAYVGGSNLFSYNHTEKIVLPGTEDFENSSIVLENGKDMNLFVRCMDKNGNENEAEYAIRFCVDPSPDNTAPQVKATSITSGGCVAENQDSSNVDFYINEPAECRWSPQDQSYDNMQNQMTCSNQRYQLNALQLYTCSAQLTGIPRDETSFYVRCKDQPTAAEENDRNENRQSFVFNLRGSTALKIKNLLPNGTIFGAVDPAPVELSVETMFGCDNNKAICYYSTTGEDSDYVMFFDTNTDDGFHTQRQDLSSGNHKYFYKCVDSGGNVAIDTAEFTLDIDTAAPVVARVYEEDNMLKIVTVRDSQCVYTNDNCDFTFAEGTEMPFANTTIHVAEWKEDETFYIKCRDEFKNEEADCSIIVRPSLDFL